MTHMDWHDEPEGVYIYIEIFEFLFLLCNYPEEDELNQHDINDLSFYSLL